MTDAPTPVVLDEDQGSLRASPFVPTEGVTASGDGWPTDSYRAIAIELHHTVEELTYGLPEVLSEHALADEESLIPKALRTMDVTAFRLANLDVENSPSPALGGDEAQRSEPVEVTIFCPVCAVPHIDEGEWATTRHHKTHQCQSCGHEWRPFPFATVGVPHPAPTPVGGLEPHCQLCGGEIEGWVCQTCEADFEEVGDHLILMSDNTVSTLQAEIERLRALSDPKNWRDRDDEWSHAIRAAHPVNSDDPKRHDRFMTALKMVGNRHGKYELVALVQWLLTRAETAEALGKHHD